VLGNASRPLGFRIEHPLELQGWSVLEVDTDLPMEAAPECPADGATMKTLCTLTSGTGDTHVRIGCCTECGHISYVDRPTKQWIDDYYRDVWDSAAARTTGEGAAAERHKLIRATDKKEKSPVRLADRLSIDRSLPICEIGCGFGVSLRQLASKGFTRLVGVEASRHRADVARSDGFDVLTTPFEASETRSALQRRGPFALIFAYHSLEHTYHPDSVFAAAAELQEPGGYLIVSVPHQQGEPSMGVLLFLPHLHSFTSASLARLAGRHGYAISDASASNAKNLNVVFRRTGTPVTIAASEGAYARAVSKFVAALELDRPRVGRRRLWWSRRSDEAGQVWTGPPDVLGRWNWKRSLARIRRDGVRSVVVTNLRAMRRPDGVSPLEIQFRGHIGLFVK